MKEIEKYKRLGINYSLAMFSEEAEIDKIGDKMNELNYLIPDLLGSSFEYSPLSKQDDSSDFILFSMPVLPQGYSDVFGYPIMDPRPQYEGNIFGYYKIVQSPQGKNNISKNVKIEAFRNKNNPKNVFLSVYSQEEEYYEVIISLNNYLNFDFLESVYGLTQKIAYKFENEQLNSQEFKSNKFLYSSTSGSMDMLSIYLIDDQINTSQFNTSSLYIAADADPFLAAAYSFPPKGCWTGDCSGGEGGEGSGGEGSAGYDTQSFTAVGLNNISEFLKK